MTSALAFFPWVSIEEPQTYGAVRLLPYRRGRLPGDLPGVSQADIDAVLASYSGYAKGSTDAATLLEVDDWQLGGDPDSVLERLFDIKEWITTAALACRRLFRGHFQYCNSETFTLMVQRFQAGRADRFAFGTRRRDGGTRNFWAASNFAFYRPLHVPAHPKFDFDVSLFGALMDLPPGHTHLRESVIEFNRANTDSPDIPQHVELVMVKSALESLLQCGSRERRFRTRLLELVDSHLAVAAPNASARWVDRYKGTNRPIEAWATEFCRLRGVSAHGMERGQLRPIWLEAEHLAFVSVLFPLLLKLVLADLGLLEIERIDRGRLYLVETLLAVDPLRHDTEDGAKPHPWSEYESKAIFWNCGDLLNAIAED
jgi:hypothetical protein